tara:strand:+ start:3275 stop:4426 length:1152 start_codon:yes stop_codon:yes gene_type:complete
MHKISVCIVGGGPVGLFLGIALAKLNISCFIIERRAAPVPDSRSLGIHPVSMELFQLLGMETEFSESGIHIQKGIAHDGTRKLGEIDFSSLKKPYNFILSCPQFKTEQILKETFLALNPSGLIQEAEVTDIRHDEKEVVCWYKKDGREFQISSDFLVGCDGKNSLIRQKAGILFGGKRYPDTYIMSDFEDTTEFGSKATVFLPKDGMLECFPLPNGMRRWVVKTEKFVKNPTQALLAELIRKRLGYDLTDTKCTMLSSFGVQYFMAEQFFKNRIILAGDSAHVVSPIGGQGMNLGWIGAWKLSQALSSIQEQPTKAEHYLSQYQKEQQLISKKVALRAEWNMRLGRKRTIPFFKKAFISVLLNTPLRKLAAEQFAMRGLVKVI